MKVVDAIYLYVIYIRPIELLPFSFPFKTPSKA